MAALQRQELLGEEVRECRQTHVSWLLFTAAHVYKIKKPVDLGFLDFTDPERRRRLCHDEVRLNRRFSPDVYLGVVRIVDRSDGGTYRLEPDTEGEPATEEVVAWAVRMRRLPDDGWLSARVAAGTADRTSVHRVAHRIVGFQLLAERGPEITEAGSWETVRDHVRQNFEQVEPYVDEAVSRRDFRRVRAYSAAFLEVREEEFRRREREGRIRDGHGDLHAGNIHLGDGIEFIDCIEFDPGFRCGDVAADLAFTAMDLDFHGRPDLADALMLESMARSGDNGMLRVLAFYKCYRAFTRGKVEAMAADDPGGSETEDHLARARKYFELASHYARPRCPLLVITAGLMGTGKSTLAASLAEILDADVISSDVVRKRLAGMPEDAPAREDWKEGIYDESATERTYARLSELAGSRLRRGRSVILDASFTRRVHRKNVLATASDAGARCLVLETVVDREIQRQRLRGRESGGYRGPSDGRLAIADAQRDAREHLDELEGGQHVVLDTDRPAAEVTEEALLETYRRLLSFAPDPRPSE